jgi:hypothetical protein
MNTPRSLFDLCLCRVQQTATDIDRSWWLNGSGTYCQRLLPQHVLRRLAHRAAVTYQARYELIIEELLQLDRAIRASLYFRCLDPGYARTPADKNFILTLAQAFQAELCTLVRLFFQYYQYCKLIDFKELAGYGQFIQDRLFLMNKWARACVVYVNKCPYVHSEAETSCNVCDDCVVKEEFRPKCHITPHQLKCQFACSRYALYMCPYRLPVVSTPSCLGYEPVRYDFEWPFDD